MRAEKDRKHTKTSVTMTDEDYNVIEEKAQKRGLKISPFLVESARHSDEIFTPEKKANVQNLINDACREFEGNKPDKINELQKGLKELW